MWLGDLLFEGVVQLGDCSTGVSESSVSRGNHSVSFYFGTRHKFWDSSPLHQFTKEMDRAALTAYLLGLPNLRHVSDQFRRPGDEKVLVLRHGTFEGSTLCSLQADSSVSEFPANAHFNVCVRTYFDGKPFGHKIFSCLYAHRVTALSLLDPKLLSESLKLGITSRDLKEIEKFSALYSVYCGELPDPARVAPSSRSIVQCMGVWGSEPHTLSQMETFLNGFQKEDLCDLTIEKLSDCNVPLGAKLALLNILSRIESRPSKRKGKSSASSAAGHKIARNIPHIASTSDA